MKNTPFHGVPIYMYNYLWVSLWEDSFPSFSYSCPHQLESAPAPPATIITFYFLKDSSLKVVSSDQESLCLKLIPVLEDTILISNPVFLQSLCSKNKRGK
jgi:hypothetical protein